MDDNHDDKWRKSLEEKAFSSSGFYRWCVSEGVKPDISIDLMMADAYAEACSAPLVAEIERLSKQQTQEPPLYKSVMAKQSSNTYREMRLTENGVWQWKAHEGWLDNGSEPFWWIEMPEEAQ